LRILIADDHTLFRDSLRSLLTARGFEVIAEAGDGREAVELARRLQPDVILMDLGMPGIDGLAATRLISAEVPQVKVVILTASDDDAKLFEAIKSGAQGYLLKNLESREFFSLLEGVSRGEPALTPALARKLLQEFARPPQPAPERDPDALTDREREVLELVAKGQSNAEIAAGLFVSHATVKTHVSRLLMKLDARDRAQLVMVAYETGVASPGAA
jgi:DNA-binding NarL/FixJ family response regulator